MQILALGLPRTGTNSLCKALTDLGFNHTYHGFDTLDNTEDNVAWCQLMQQKNTKSGSLTAKDFDRVIGHAVAVTDVPCATFAPELIAAYPNAKIIVNHRPDVDAYVRSITSIMDESFRQSGMLANILQFFHPKVFWMREMFRRTQWRPLWKKDWHANARATYHEHYDMLERLAPKERTLWWKVEDGWEPLCAFLDKPVPKQSFPKGNALDAFLEHVMGRCHKLGKQAFLNMIAVMGLLVAGMVGGVLVRYPMIYRRA